MAAIEYRGMNAVTNFDLSTYIRWLRSNANSNPSQDPTTPTTNSQSIQTTPNHPNPVEDIGFSFNSNPFSMEKPCNIFPQKQELIERKMPISPSNKSLTSSSSSSSSPTALGLLLRSSMFKELVEKNSNSNASDEEMEGNDTKKHRSNPSVEDEFGGIFNYSGISSDFKEESGSPFFKPSFFQLTNN